MEPDAAERLLVKLRRFVTVELDPQERALFAALVAPAVASVWDDDEVEAYGVGDLRSHHAGGWSPPSLPDTLRDALRKGTVRIEGFEP